MKKIFLCLIISFLSAKLFAANMNDCIQHIDGHVNNEPSKATGLYLFECDIHSADIPFVVSYLEKYPNINDLILGENHVDDEGAVLLSKNTTIKTLSICDNDLTSKGAIALAHMSNLYRIDLSNTPFTRGNNHIGDDGIAAFAEHPNIAFIEADDNQIGDEGVIKLSKNKNIIFLMLSDNHITDKGAAAIGLAKTIYLYVLDVSYNHIGPTGLKALMNNPHFRDLRTQGNDGSGLVSNNIKHEGG
jgi:hypothetical protein